MINILIQALAALLAITAVVLIVWYVFVRLARRHLVSKYIAASINFATVRQFEAQKKDIRVLCLGTCEFRAGLDARKLAPDAFNFSIPLVSFVEYYFFLKRYLDEMPKLKLLVLSTHLNSFCSRSAEGTAAPMIFSKHVNLRELLSISRPDNWPRIIWRNLFYSSDVSKIQGGARIMMKNLKKSIEKTKTSEPQVSQRLLAPRGPGGTVTDDDAASGVRKHFSRPTFDSRALSCFEKLLKLCRDRNITVVTVGMPCSEKSMKFIGEYKFVKDGEIESRIVNGPVYRELIYSVGFRLIKRK